MTNEDILKRARELDGLPRVSGAQHSKPEPGQLAIFRSMLAVVLNVNGSWAELMLSPTYKTTTRWPDSVYRGQVHRHIRPFTCLHSCEPFSGPATWKVRSSVMLPHGKPEPSDWKKALHIGRESPSSVVSPDSGSLLAQLAEQARALEHQWRGSLIEAMRNEERRLGIQILTPDVVGHLGAGMWWREQASMAAK